MAKQIRITCDTKLRIPYNQLHGIQGGLKILTAENFEKLRKQILREGVTFAIHVWKQVSKSKGKTVVKWWIVDGHGRHIVITTLIEKDGYSCAPLPCVEIEAKSFEDAKRKVLAASSSYHSMTKDGLYEFMSGSGITIEQLEEYTLPEIDFQEFKMEFYDSPEKASEKDGKETVTFDAYKNAAVKQIVLYFASADYEKVVKRLDQLAAEMKLEDYSQVVWRLLGEKGSPKSKEN